MWANKEEGKDMLVVRGYCYSSLKSKATYTVYLILTSGDVLAVQCMCIAGKGEACGHVAALLFYIEDIKRTEVKHLPSDKTVTDRLQQWHVPPKRSVAATVQNRISQGSLWEETAHKAPCCKSGTPTKSCIGPIKT